MARNKKLKIFLQILGILIFIYILSQINYPVLLKELKMLKWQFLILAFFIMIAEIIFRSLRWRVILSSLNINISLLESLSLFWLGAFFSIITPGRIGELIKVYFLKNKGAGIFRSFLSVVLDRLIDIFILLIFSFLVFMFFLKAVGIYMIFFAGILLAGIIFIFLIINEKSLFHRIFGKMIQKIFSVDLSNYNRFSFKKLWEGIRGLEKKQVFYFFVYLAASWILYFLAKYAIGLSLGIKLSFVNLAIVSVLIMLANTVPISIAGLGTREAAVIYFLGLFGINRETALLFSLMIFFVDILIISFGLIPYMRESALIDNFKKSEPARS